MCCSPFQLRFPALAASFSFGRYALCNSTFTSPRFLPHSSPRLLYVRLLVPLRSPSMLFPRCEPSMRVLSHVRTRSFRYSFDSKCSSEHCESSYILFLVCSTFSSSPAFALRPFSLSPVTSSPCPHARPRTESVTHSGPNAPQSTANLSIPFLFPFPQLFPSPLRINAPTAPAAACAARSVWSVSRSTSAPTRSACIFLKSSRAF